MVEAAGVEPASEDETAATSTGLVVAFLDLAGLFHCTTRETNKPALDLTPSPRAMG